jgi:hypothetical protein
MMSDDTCGNGLRYKYGKDMLSIFGEPHIVIVPNSGVNIVPWAILKDAAKLKQLGASKEITENFELVLMKKQIAAKSQL